MKTYAIAAIIGKKSAWFGSNQQLRLTTLDAENEDEAVGKYVREIEQEPDRYIAYKLVCCCDPEE